MPYRPPSSYPSFLPTVVLLQQALLSEKLDQIKCTVIGTALGRDLVAHVPYRLERSSILPGRRDPWKNHHILRPLDRSLIADIDALRLESALHKCQCTLRIARNDKNILVGRVHGRELFQTISNSDHRAWEPARCLRQDNALNRIGRDLVVCNNNTLGAIVAAPAYSNLSMNKTIVDV